MTTEQENLIIKAVRDESERIKFGKVLIEVTVLKGRPTNVQVETRRSININETA